jgi:hypothetical protein
VRGGEGRGVVLGEAFEGDMVRPKAKEKRFILKSLKQGDHLIPRREGVAT